jgi:hypothetical protein
MSARVLADDHASRVAVQDIADFSSADPKTPNSV